MAIVFSFSYPGFYADGRRDPMHILGFIVGHIALIIIGGSFIVPRWYNALIPAHRQNEGKIPYGPGVTQGTLEAELADAAENANGTTTSQDLGEKDSTPNGEGLVKGDGVHAAPSSHGSYGDKEINGEQSPREDPLIRER